ncbi:MAG: tyrosine-type recombinase/integrase [Pirellulaceae bacterium]
MVFSEPWFREFDGWWYCHHRENGSRRQVKLAKGRDNREAAFDRWAELRSGATPKVQHTAETVAYLLDLYLDWCQSNRADGTYQVYKQFLQSFCDHLGEGFRVSKLKPKDATAWIGASTWSDSTKAGAVQTVRTAFRWMVREGHLDHSPVQGASGPSKRGREVILSTDQFQAILDHSRPDFALLLEFLWRSGCRPQEAVRIEAKHCELHLRRIVFPPSQAKGKKHPRVIYLDDRALEIVRGLLAKRPAGILFRNAKGTPWNRNMVRQRFLRLRKHVGGRFCAYHLRHSYATNALQRLDPILVATLMGHSDAATLARNYQHLAKLPTVMAEAAMKATAGIK